MAELSQKIVECGIQKTYVGPLSSSLTFSSEEVACYR